MQQTGRRELRGGYERAFDLDFTILRYGSLYGPRADATNGLYRVVRDALLSRSISYDGNPDSIREYIHVEDAARASVRALDEEFRNESVVLTGNQPMRVVDLLKMLAEILGYPERRRFPKRVVRWTLRTHSIRLSAEVRAQVRADTSCRPRAGVAAADR